MGWHLFLNKVTTWFLTLVRVREVHEFALVYKFGRYMSKSLANKG
jgi:hypothetical protein